MSGCSGVRGTWAGPPTSKNEVLIIKARSFHFKKIGPTSATPRLLKLVLRAGHEQLMILKI